MKLSEYPLKTFASVAFFASIVLFNLTQPKGPTAEQRSYSAWLDSVEKSEQREGHLPDGIVVLFHSEIPDQQFEWKLSSDSKLESAKVLRVLELAREAAIDNLIESNPAEFNTPVAKPGMVTLQVRDSSKAFIAYLSPAKVERNIRLQTMAKIMEVAQSEIAQVARRKDTDGKNKR